MSPAWVGAMQFLTHVAYATRSTHSPKSCVHPNAFSMHSYVEGPGNAAALEEHGFDDRSEGYVAYPGTGCLRDDL